MIFRKFDPSVRRHYFETESGAKIYLPHSNALTTLILSDLRDVSIYAELIAENEDEASWDDLCIWDDLENKEILFDSLPKVDQDLIEETLNRIASDQAHDLYYESQRAAAEAYYDGDR